MDTIRKQFNFEVKQVADRVLRFTGSTETLDRDNEVIKVSGWELDNYKKNPVFMWAHDYSQPPIGKAINVHKRQGNLIFDIEFADKDTYDFADTIYKLYQGGFLHATSVGFMPDPDYIIEGDGIKTPRRTYTKQELLELSAVPVPSNPDALRNAADKIGVSFKSLEKVFDGLADDIKTIADGDITITSGYNLTVDDMSENLATYVTKPEETDDYIRIPVRECEITATIDISEKEGIKALYCGKEKKVRTYLFRKDHGWTMEKAKKWVKEHDGKSIDELLSLGIEIEHKEKPVSQEEIKDEIDYLDSLIEKVGLSSTTEALIRKLLRRLPADDIAVKISDDKVLSRIIESSVKKATK